MYRHSWRPFWTCTWDLPVSLMNPFTGKKQNFRSWDYSAQVSDYQDFQIIGCWIKRMLLYILLYLSAKVVVDYSNVNFINYKMLKILLLLLFKILVKICILSLFCHVKTCWNCVMQLWKLIFSAHCSSVAIVLANKMWIQQCKCCSCFWKAEYFNCIWPKHVRDY
jgi:hypothetical protein